MVAPGTHVLDALKVARDLLDLYAESRADLVLDSVASPTDAQIYAEMMYRIEPASAAVSNFNLVRDEPEATQVLTS